MTVDPNQDSETEGAVLAAFAELADRRERTTNLGEAYKGVVAKPKRRLVWPAMGATVLAVAAVAVVFGLSSDDQAVELGPASPPTTEAALVEDSVVPPTTEVQLVEESPPPTDSAPESSVPEQIDVPPPEGETPIADEPPADDVPVGFFPSAEAAIADALTTSSIEYRGDCESLVGRSGAGWCSTYSTVPLPAGLLDYDLFEVINADAFTAAGFTLQQRDGGWRVVDDHVHDVIYADRDGTTYDISDPESVPQNLLVDIFEYWEFPVSWCDQLAKERVGVSCIDAEPGLFPDVPYGTWTVRLQTYDEAGEITAEGNFPFAKNGDFYEYVGPN